MTTRDASTRETRIRMERNIHDLQRVIRRMDRDFYLLGDGPLDGTYGDLCRAKMEIKQHLDSML